MKKILIAAGLILFTSTVFAQEIPVGLKADKLKFIEGTGIVEAAGSVEVKLEKVTIRADSMRMDPETNIVTAEGNVKMFGDDYQSLSDSITYRASDESATFSRFNTRLSPSRVKGELFLSADDLTEKDNVMKGEKGGVTTCEKEEPHYFARAEKLEYYPNDKIVGYNVLLYVGKMPVMWMPYMLYDLKSRQKRNWVFGRNEVEGDYVKTSWDYPYGILYLDLMEKKGFGYGTEADYGLAALGLGTLYLYHVAEKDTGISDWVTKVHNVKQLNQWTTLSLDDGYKAMYLIPSGRSEQSSFGLDLTYNNKAKWDIRLNTLDDRLGAAQKYAAQLSQSYDKISTDYSFNYDLSTRDPKWIRASQLLAHRRPLWSDNVTLNGRAEYHNDVATGGAPGDERLEPSVDIVGQEKNYSWRFSENWYIDADGGAYTADNNYQFLEKQPEIELSINPIDLNLFTLKPAFGYGYYREVRYVPQLGKNRDFGTQRYAASLSASKSVPVALGTVATFGLGADQLLYGTGDMLYVYRENLGLQTNLFGFFRNNVNYQKALTDGNTPYFFDYVGTHYHNIQEELTFDHLGKYVWTTSGGYNWQTAKWMEVMTHLKLSPTDKFSWNLRTGWDIENRKYKDLVNALTIIPRSFFSLELSTLSDLNVGELRSGSIVYDMLFLEGEDNQWRLKIGQVYDPSSRDFKVRDIMMVKDLHCWQLKFSYSDYRREFSFTFSLKALPDEPAGFSSGRGFYVEGFDKEFNDVIGKGDVRRY